MAGGTTEPGSSGPQQPQPMYGTQMPMGYAQQYGPPQAATDWGQTLRKLFLIMVILVGGLLILIARIMGIYSSSLDLTRAARLVATFGGLIIAGSSVVWALGSKRTTDWQNLGLLILAAIMLSVFGAV